MSSPTELPDLASLKLETKWKTLKSQLWHAVDDEEPLAEDEVDLALAKHALEWVTERSVFWIDARVHYTDALAAIMIRSDDVATSDDEGKEIPSPEEIAAMEDQKARALAVELLKDSIVAKTATIKLEILAQKHGVKMFVYKTNMW